ncbi:undecaprenyl-phosphate alpha-N-acetylglucosaminyl 1-phosphate transferase [candidate division KSB3 bacterium]|uniref:Undecaprenyl-phosphate alpha-N-acetylglucosaminyl 1-phosphate transferase n=1 Tax=candidate division KSB3 bacterium TaxID=2044937 RepID=A0A2G6KAM1_9BACT|nr:MAG: undecaprenyl-phosphate alpha-N-acetylglucosaminyl 1-phosphate transferase [candidate division KSB3 bacterium]
MLKELIRDYIILTLMAFLISLFVTPFVRKFCRKNHMLDFPTTSRKIHSTPVPRLGGIAIYLAFFLPLFTVFLTDGIMHDLFMKHVDTLMYVCLASTLMFLVGVYDDIWGLSAMTKLSFQIVAAILLYALGFKIQLISIPFIGSVPLGTMGLPLTILWVVGVTNAINFIDGIDGLACGVGFFAVSTMFILSLYLSHPMTAAFAAALAGGLFGFALYNFSPASIFMGDSGSLFIGFVIAAISLHGSQKSSTAVVLLIPVVALGVPLADTLFAILRRIGKGLSPFAADQEHIHHRLLRMGFSSRQVVLLLYIICCCLGMIALLMTAVTNQALTLILILLSVLTIGGMKVLGYTTDVFAIHALARKRIERRKQLLKQQRLADEFFSELERAEDILQLKTTLSCHFDLMGFDSVRIVNKSLPLFEYRWQNQQTFLNDRLNKGLWAMTIPLEESDGKISGELFIERAWDSREVFLENTLFLETLKRTLEHSFIKVEQRTRSSNSAVPCGINV